MEGEVGGGLKISNETEFRQRRSLLGEGSDFLKGQTGGGRKFGGGGCVDQLIPSRGKRGD